MYTTATAWESACEATLSPYVPDKEVLRCLVAGVMAYVPTYDLLKVMVFVGDDMGSIGRRKFSTDELPSLVRPFIESVGHDLLTENMTKALLMKAYQQMYENDASARTTGGSVGMKRKQVSGMAPTYLCNTSLGANLRLHATVWITSPIKHAAMRLYLFSHAVTWATKALCTQPYSWMAVVMSSTNT